MDIIKKIKESSKPLIDNAEKIANKTIDKTVELAQKAKDIDAKKALDLALKAKDKSVDLAVKAKDKTINKYNEIKEDQKEKQELKRKAEEERYNIAIQRIKDASCYDFFELLGNSPIPLDSPKINKIKACFPIPREQYILWADAEFDLRPSGVVLTDKGLYIRSNEELFKKEDKIDSSITETKEKIKSQLFYYSLFQFDPSSFISEDKNINQVLLVEPQCRDRFMQTCKFYKRGLELQYHNIQTEILNDFSDKNMNASIVGTNSSLACEEAVFLYDKSLASGNGSGHGEMAEQGNNMYDRLHGLDAKVVGGNNAKNGADRIVNGVEIQCKYYNSAIGSLEACFDSDTKMYRYHNSNGEPMKLEVPKDQYQEVLRRFENKIKQGKVANSDGEIIKDPNEAKNIVKEGKYTYQEAKNLTKAGTIESLKYDAINGVITSTCAFGISFVITTFLVWHKTGNVYEGIQAGVMSGIKIFGLTFIQHMAVSQLARTNVANLLMKPSQFIVNKLGTEASQTIVNGIRSLVGKNAISGAAASKHLAKILRGNVLTSAITIAAFSIPDTYNLFTKKISGTQYAKNLSSIASSVIGGVGGSVVAGVAAAKVGAVIGTGVAPVVGTVVGIAGGLVGGMVGSTITNKTSDILLESDGAIYARLLNSYTSYLATEYFLNENEISLLVKELETIKGNEFERLFKELSSATNQEQVIRNFLIPIFDKVIEKRNIYDVNFNEELNDSLLKLFGSNLLIEA